MADVTENENVDAVLQQYFETFEEDLSVLKLPEGLKLYRVISESQAGVFLAMENEKIFKLFKKILTELLVKDANKTQVMTAANAKFTLEKVIGSLESYVAAQSLDNYLIKRGISHFKMGPILSELYATAKESLSKDSGITSTIAVINSFKKREELDVMILKLTKETEVLKLKYDNLIHKIFGVIAKEKQNYLEYKETHKARLAGHTRHAAITASDERAYCKFFAKGECKYGDKCKFRHDAPTSGASQTVCKYFPNCNQGNKCKYFHPAAVNKGNVD